MDNTIGLTGIAPAPNLLYTVNSGEGKSSKAKEKREKCEIKIIIK